LVTDGYEVKYTGTNPGICDILLSEVWYNRTRFAGDTFRAGKNAQIPQLKQLLFSPSGNDGLATTDGDGASFGYRNEAVFGTQGLDHFAVGTDLILLKQGLNDVEILRPADSNNFPIPKSRSVDVGFFAERIVSPVEGVRVNAGSRADVVNTNAQANIDGLDEALFDYLASDLEQNFTLWSAYLTSEVDLTEHWIGTMGFGYAQRPPTLTELYAVSPFIGSLQRGLTFLDGDPLLNPEQLKQLDIGLRGNYNQFKGGVHAYQSWVKDYITYDLVDPPTSINDGLGLGASFVNTDLAILRGVESFGRYQMIDSLALFGVLSYVQGDDRSRSKPSRLADDGGRQRSDANGVDREPLPGIAPLDSRAGVLIHDKAPGQRWGVELSTRMVARQNRIAATLAEIETPGFMTMDVRSYRRFQERSLLTAGVENLTNRFYREHLDYRSGLGVFRPGINFYTGLEFNY
jgi:iron complex outermembrane recepter protein